MNESAALLKQYASDAGLAVSPEQLEQFSRYADLLTEWNQKVNLTAVTEPEGIASKHFLDSILILKYIKIPKGAKVIDIGTGAGFPGVPLLLERLPRLGAVLLVIEDGSAYRTEDIGLPFG